jgi:hypothetical protein
MPYSMDGDSIRTGDVVGFKADIEQYGRVVAICGEMITIKNPSGFSGAYLCGSTEVQLKAGDCWKD